MNSINIVGNITQDLELKKVGEDLSLLKFSIAVNEGFGDNKKSYFFDVEAWRGKADVISQYFKKGDKIGISGRLKQDTWKDQEGKNRSKVSIVLNDFDFMQKGGNNNGNNASQSYSTPENNAPKDNVNFADYNNDNEDIPF